MIVDLEFGVDVDELKIYNSNIHSVHLYVSKTRRTNRKLESWLRDLKEVSNKYSKFVGEKRIANKEASRWTGILEKVKLR